MSLTKLPELTMEGRRCFGEFVANALLGAAGAVGFAVVLPTWAGSTPISPFAFAAGALIFLLRAGGAIAVRYLTEERLGEGEGWPR